MIDQKPRVPPEMGDDRLLDRQVAAAVFGYRIAVGPGGHFAATSGAGPATKLVEVPPVSSDLTAAWEAATAAMSDGHADGFSTGVMHPAEGAPEYRATFIRNGDDGPMAVCGAVAESIPRAICGALLALYEGVSGGRANAPTSRNLQ